MPLPTHVCLQAFCSFSDNAPRAAKSGGAEPMGGAVGHIASMLRPPSPSSRGMTWMWTCGTAQAKRKNERDARQTLLEHLNGSERVRARTFLASRRSIVDADLKVHRVVDSCQSTLHVCNAFHESRPRRGRELGDALFLLLRNNEGVTRTPWIDVCKRKAQA